MLKKNIAAFDIDGTFYRDSLFISLIDELRRRKILPDEPFARSDELKKHWKSRRAPYGEYLSELVRPVDAGILKGVREADVRIAAEAVLEQNGEDVYMFTRTLFETCHASGYLTAAISHSPSVVVELFAKRWGFDVASGTDYRIENGVYLGDRVKKHKRDVFQTILVEHGCAAEDSIAIGDTESDLDLFGQVTFPLAFNPSRALELEARRLIIPVVKERKDTIEVWVTPHSIVPFQEVSLTNCLPEPLGRALTASLMAYGFNPL